MRFLFLFLLALPGVLLMLAAAGLQAVSYAEALRWVEGRFSTVYNAAYIGYNYFTANQFRQMRALAAIAAGAWWAGWLCFRFCQPLRAFASKAAAEAMKPPAGLMRYLAALPRRQQAVLAGLLLLAATLWVYRLVTVPFMVDEVFAYNYFVHPSPVVAVFYYPEPNNHILFNLVACVFDLLPLQPVWVMRLPPLFFGLGVLVLLYAYLHRHMHGRVAGLAVALAAVGFPTGFYAALGRGYLPAAFWALLALMSLFEWERYRRGRYLFWFGMAAVAGLYTLPTYLYALAGLGGYGAWVACRQGQARRWFLLWLLIGAGTLALYAPVVAFSGWRALLANPWVHRVPHAAGQIPSLLLQGLLEALSWTTGVWHKVYMLAGAGLVGIALVYRRFGTSRFLNQWLRLSAWQVVGITVLMLVWNKLPPARSYTYLAFWYPVWLALLLHYAALWAGRRWVYTLAGGLLLAGTAAWTVRSYGLVLARADGPFQRAFYHRLAGHLDQITGRRPRYVFAKDHWFQFYLRLRQIADPAAVGRLHVFKPVPGVVYDFVLVSPDVRQGYLPATFSPAKYRLVVDFADTKVYALRTGACAHPGSERMRAVPGP